jgi:Ni/Co efflux regulator RcnB
MRKLILAALMGATLVPGAAMAQNRELWRDRQDIREERRDLNQAYRYGDRRDIRDERDDYRDARREYREDVRDYRRDDRGRYDWQNHRRYNHDLYRGGGWRSEHRYRSFRPGVTLDFGYYQPRYYMNDYNRFRLPEPGWGRRWVRHYNDVLLVDVRSGRVIDVHRNFYW